MKPLASASAIWPAPTKPTRCLSLPLGTGVGVGAGVGATDAVADADVTMAAAGVVAAAAPAADAAVGTRGVGEGDEAMEASSANCCPNNGIMSTTMEVDNSMRCSLLFMGRRPVLTSGSLPGTKTSVEARLCGFRVLTPLVMKKSSWQPPPQPQPPPSRET